MMKNHIHNMASYIALILISALPLSIDAYAEAEQTSKTAPMEVSLDDDVLEQEE
jgi:hypothetical protein